MLGFNAVVFRRAKKAEISRLVRELLESKTSLSAEDLGNLENAVRRLNEEAIEQARNPKKNTVTFGRSNSAGGDGANPVGEPRDLSM